MVVESVAAVAVVASMTAIVRWLWVRWHGRETDPCVTEEGHVRMQRR